MKNSPCSVQPSIAWGRFKRVGQISGNCTNLSQILNTIIGFVVTLSAMSVQRFSVPGRPGIIARKSAALTLAPPDGGAVNIRNAENFRRILRA